MGMHGVGKTTLPTVLYDTIAHHYQFDACCFIEDVSKIYKHGGAIAVQKLMGCCCCCWWASYALPNLA